MLIATERQGNIMEIGFIMDELKQINPVWETTAHIMYECNQRGHTVYFLQPHDVYIRKNEVVARMRRIRTPPDKPIQEYWQDVIQCLNKEELIFEILTDLNVLFLRKDPPLVYEMMEFLSPVSDKIFMINNILGMINASTKAYILNFPTAIPETHVSRDPVRLKRIIDDFGGDMVIKPLHGHGGHGVIKVSNRDQENLNSLIHYYVQTEKPYSERRPIMVQEYLKQVREEGDVRILLLDGKILGAMGRRSVSGDFRTNLHAGGVEFEYHLTQAQIDLCQQIKPRLRKDGLYFVGLDLIGDKLIEVNCVSPGGIPRINQLNNVRIESDIIDFIEKHVHET